MKTPAKKLRKRSEAKKELVKAELDKALGLLESPFATLAEVMSGTATKPTQNEYFGKMGAPISEEQIYSRAKVVDPAQWEAGLNPEQLEVVNHNEGPCVVLAGAGSGKTGAICNRVVRMVKRDYIDAARIGAFTFSKKAADEMNTRIKKLGVTDARVGTWHSLYLQILKEDDTEWSTWEVDSKNRDVYALKDVLGWKHMKWEKSDFTKVKNFIGWCKSHLWEPDSNEAIEYARTKFGADATKAVEAFSRYNDLIAERRLLTFDDFQVFVHKHLSIEENRVRWASRYDFLIQDEAQDANPAQIVIARLLAQDHRNYMVVGDLAQSIYGFRGSQPSYLAGFAAEWSAKVVNMHRNYRCGRAIIKVANDIIRPATMRMPTDLTAERDLEGKVTVLRSANLDDEAHEFAAWIKACLADGAKYSDITALFRTNAQSRALEEALLGERIPYVVVGGTSFYERKEVKDLLAYLRVARGRGDVTDSVKRCINAPFRFLGAKFVERLQDATDGAGAIFDWGQAVREVASQEGIQARQKSSALEWSTLIATIATRVGNPTKEDRDPAQILTWLVNRTGYITWLQKEEGEESLDASHAANVRELIRVASRFASVDELLNYIDDSINAAKRQREDKQAGGERVLLMSIHRSKGLEWPYLFVSGCNAGILPHKMGEPEEERRLAYVAATRARDVLVLSYVQAIATKDGLRDVEPSGFLFDAKLVNEDGPLLDPNTGAVHIATPGADRVDAMLEAFAAESEALAIEGGQR